MHPGGQRSASSVVFTTQGLTNLELPIDWNCWLRSPRSCQFPGMTGTNHHTSFSQGFWGSWTASTSLSEPSPQPLSLLWNSVSWLLFLFCFVLNIVNYLGIKVAKVTLNLLCSPVDPKLTETLLFRPPKCWDHEHMPPCPACSLRFWCVFPANGCCAHGVPTDCCPEILFLGAASQAFPCFNVLAFSHPFVDVLPHELPLPFLWQIHKNQLNGEGAYLACSWRPVLYPQWESREK